MWTDPFVLVFLASSAIALALLALSPGLNPRALGMVAVAVVALLGTLAVRRVTGHRERLAEDRQRHCDRAAFALEGIAVDAEAAKKYQHQTAMQISRSHLQPHGVGWVAAEISYCVGKPRFDACQVALYELMNYETYDELSIAVNALAKSIRAGTACAGAK